jgi:[ribosomal protein S18]-alanine N-acetyltransferase
LESKDLENSYRVRPLTGADADQIVHWRYPAPYDFYDSAPTVVPPGYLEVAASVYLNPVNRYFAVDDETGIFLGFGCFGAEAQVPGYAYSLTKALDIGLGMRPDQVGSGRGQPFLAAILAHGLKVHSPKVFRASIATFNQRSTRTFLRAGFVSIATFRSQGLRPTDFAVYQREA